MDTHPNGKRLDRDAWIRALAIATSVLVPGYLGYSRISDTVLLTAERVEAMSQRLARLEGIVDTIQDQRAQRGPVFDRMLIEVDDHEKRLRDLEKVEARKE